MADKIMRLSQVSRKLNIGKNTIIDFLATKGYKVEDNPNYKINEEQLSLLSKEFADSALDKEEASSLSIGSKHSENVVIDSTTDSKEQQDDDEEEIFIKSHHLTKTDVKETPDQDQDAEEKDSDIISTSAPKLQGIKVLGKIELDPKKKSTPAQTEAEKPKNRKRNLKKPLSRKTKKQLKNQKNLKKRKKKIKFRNLRKKKLKKHLRSLRNQKKKRKRKRK